jgi:hypothetical protein
MYTVWPCATPVWRIDPTNKTRHGGRAPIHPPSTPYPAGVMYGAGIDQYVLLDRVMIPLDRPPGRGSGIPAAMAAGARSWYRTGRQKLPRASAAIIVRVVKRRPRPWGKAPNPRRWARASAPGTDGNGCARGPAMLARSSIRGWLAGRVKNITGDGSRLLGSDSNAILITRRAIAIATRSVGFVPPPPHS